MTINDLGDFMVSNSIRISSPFYTKNDIMQKLKDNSFPKMNLKFVDKQIQEGNKPVLKGGINAQKFHRHFSEEQIKRMNTNRKLPNGYLLGFNPQKVIHHYTHGCYNGATIIPPTYNLIKADNLPTAKKRYLHILKKFPAGFQIMNTDDGTYITGKDVTKEELNKYLSSTIGKIKTSIRNLFNPLLKNK